MNPCNSCFDYCIHPQTTTLLEAIDDVTVDAICAANSLSISTKHSASRSLTNNKGAGPILLRSLHVGSLPPCTYNSKGEIVEEKNNSKSDDLDEDADAVPDTVNVEMTLHDFQQFLNERNLRYGHNNDTDVTSTPLLGCEQHHTNSGTYHTRHRRSNHQFLLFDPCSTLGAEVTLCDFLIRNHNNIDVQVHENIYSEEIQVSDNRRSAVMIMMNQQQSNDIFNVDSTSSSSGVEVQPIHSFDDILPPNLMNASFDDTLNNNDDDVTADMNESYTELFDDDSDDDDFNGEGGWIKNDVQTLYSQVVDLPLEERIPNQVLSSAEENTGVFFIEDLEGDGIRPLLAKIETDAAKAIINVLSGDDKSIEVPDAVSSFVLISEHENKEDITVYRNTLPRCRAVPSETITNCIIPTDSGLTTENDISGIYESTTSNDLDDCDVYNVNLNESISTRINTNTDDDSVGPPWMICIRILLLVAVQVTLLVLSYHFRESTRV